MPEGAKGTPEHAQLVMRYYTYNQEDNKLKDLDGNEINDNVPQKGVQ